MISPAGTAAAQQDVIIRLQLVGDKSNVSVADDLSKTVDVIGQKAAEASKQLGKVLQGNVDDLGRSIARLSSADAKRSQAAKSVSTSIGESLRRQEDALESVGAKAADTSRQMADGSEKAGEAAKKQAAQLENLGKEQFKAKKASVTATKAALQGALDVTEGLAVVGIASEESLDKFKKGFAKVQAGFQVFKGGLDIVLEGVTAYGELSRFIKTCRKRLGENGTQFSTPKTSRGTSPLAHSPSSRPCWPRGGRRGVTSARAASSVGSIGLDSGDLLDSTSSIRFFAYQSAYNKPATNPTATLITVS